MKNTKGKPPAFQFYAQDFLMGTLELTAEQVGAYIRLLGYQWDKGGLANDIDKLLSLAGLPRSKRKVLEVVLAKFVQCEDGQLRNLRLEKERKKTMDFLAGRSAAGKASAAKRDNKFQQNTGEPPTHVDVLLAEDGNNAPTILQQCSNNSANNSSNIAPTLLSSSSSSDTTTSYTASPPSPPLLGKGLLPVEDIKAKVLQDKVFIQQFDARGVPYDKLERWLTAFHKRLEYDNDLLKTDKDYRWHFSNWLGKMPYNTMQPEAYSPISDPGNGNSNSPTPSTDPRWQRLAEELKNRTSGSSTTQ